MVKEKKDKTKKNKNDIDLLNISEDLLLRHEKFIEEYLVCFNGTLAWQLSHPGASDEVASASASRLLRNVKIKAELEKRFKEQTMGKSEVLARLKDQAGATLHPFVKVDDDGHIYFNFKDKEAKKHFHLIKKVKHRKVEMYNEKSGESKEENWVEVELHDPQKALELIGKYHALFTDKVESTERKVIRVTIRKENDE